MAPGPSLVFFALSLNLLIGGQILGTPKQLAKFCVSCGVWQCAVGPSILYFIIPQKILITTIQFFKK